MNNSKTEVEQAEHNVQANLERLEQALEDAQDGESDD